MFQLLSFSSCLLRVLVFALSREGHLPTLRDSRGSIYHRLMVATINETEWLAFYRENGIANPLLNLPLRRK
ncbi:hypothetical protein F4819DRAFT_36067 [Hypoxylon fuscum]|nr:hypothetical protein F4819DRAFT_36067 [Hypoxylon fuscum]